MPEYVLIPLFESYTGQKPEQMQELPSSGSNRRYFRLQGGGVSLMGVAGCPLPEATAAISACREAGFR